MAARFRHGSAPLMVDHTPAAAVAAGQIITLGDAVRVAKQDIAANKKGALCAGGAVFRFDKPVGGGTAIADGAPVYADIANQTGTNDADSGSNKQAGLAVGAAGDSDAYVEVHLGAN